MKYKYKFFPLAENVPRSYMGLATACNLTALYNKGNSLGTAEARYRTLI